MFEPLKHIDKRFIAVVKEIEKGVRELGEEGEGELSVAAVLSEELAQVVDEDHVVGRVLIAENGRLLHLNALVFKKPETREN